eukprot:gene11774-15755_t
MTWNHIGLWLDEILFPAWSDQLIIKPLFLIGNARSGTTWLHRLIISIDANIESNRNTFTTFKTWEILLAVSVTWKSLFHSLYLFDHRYLYGFVLKFVLFLEKQLIGNIDIHPVGLLIPEEDDWLMIHVCCSQLIMFFFPMGGYLLNDLVYFDYNNNQSMKGSLLMKEFKQDIMRYYHNCVKKHLYFHEKVLVLPSIQNHQAKNNLFSQKDSTNKSKIFLSKNPAFTMRIESLYETFPDARIVCLLRDPVQSVPSMVSYISQVWHAFASPVQWYPNTHDLLFFCEVHYKYPIQQLTSDKKPESQWAFVSYHTLIKSLVSTIEHLLIRLYGDCDSIDLSVLKPRLLKEQNKASKKILTSLI